MKRFFYIFFFAILSVMSFYQVVSFDLSDTALSAEEVKAKTGKAVKLIYPTSMKSKIPAMECNVQVDGLGPFSVAEGRQVMFAPGNLQFNAALGTHQCADGTTQNGTWRFAEHQWDYVGDASNGNVYHNGTKCDNANISETYDGWIDLFGWGTSGWNNTAKDSYAVNYQPWSSSTSTVNTSYNDYGYGPSTNQGYGNLTGSNAYFDWGVYNQIGSDAPGTWRTLTYDEWSYVYSGRANAKNLHGLATVNGVHGFVLLPDDFWSNSGSLAFTSGTDIGWDVNRFTVSQWREFEQRGAVFLPSGGYRSDSSVSDVGSYGYFWSVSQFGSDYAWLLYFNSGDSGSSGYYRGSGRSVRLSQDLSDTALSAEEVKAKTGKAVKLIYPTSMKSKIPAMECNVSVDGLGPFSVAEGRQVMFAPGNLQFNAAQGSHQCADGTTQNGTWRFAEHQWDYVGGASNGNVYHNGTKCNNGLISETYDGWIDLFGWGTSGWNSGAVAYLPWSTSMGYYDYYPGGNENNDLTGAYANADWGVYNQIGSDAPGTWRTLTYEEWNYVYSGRANANNLKGQATVNGVTGFILLPDDWESPNGITFTAGTSLNFTTNTYTTAQWALMEQRGAVFLPSGGYRYGSSGVYYVGSRGYFWSVSHYSSYSALNLYFYSGYSSMSLDDRSDGRSVRLSQDL